MYNRDPSQLAGRQNQTDCWASFEIYETILLEFQIYIANIC